MSAQLKDIKLNEGNEIIRQPEDDGSRAEKLLVRVALPPHEEFYAPTFHPDNATNQLQSALGRVMGEVPKPSPAGIASLMRTAKLWGRTIYPVTQQDLSVMPNRYSGNKKKRYLEALTALETSPVVARDARCTAFVKAERFDGAEKRDPDPRMIQFRGSKYCVELASYLQPGEHQLYVTKFGSRGVPPTRNIAKGLNQHDRAMLLLTKMSHFDNPVVLSLDGSRFDKHVDIELLRVEHFLYRHFNRCKRFAQLLSLQLVNYCATKLGLKYKVKGKRMSGDMNTALGNCVLMLLMLVTFCLELNLTKFDSLDDGDDCLLIVEEHNLQLIESMIFQKFLAFGMEMKVDGVARRMEDVVFCRSRPVEYSPGQWKFVRNYRDVVSKSLCGIRHWNDPVYRERVIKAIGTCELSLNSGIPVLQAFAVAVLRNTQHVAFDVKYLSDGLRSRYNRESHHEVRERPINDECRLSFYRAFGVSIEHQLELESFFNSWKFDIRAKPLYWGQEWTRDWIPEQSYVERSNWQNAQQDIFANPTAAC